MPLDSTPFLVRSLLLSLLATGCFVSKDDIAAYSDKDGDKVPVGTDCDDDDPQVTGEIEWFADVDGDGFGAGDVQSGCPAERPTTNTADNADDCDDSNPSAFPGAEERYYDGVDQDCAGEDADGNGSIDDFDQDSDGWEQDQDCDDTDPTLRPDPSLTEVPYDGIDNDCDLTTGDGDKDGDGFWSVDYYTKAAGSTLSPPIGFDGDCLDDVDAPEQDASPHNGFDGLPPESVHPDVAEDAPYDGIDADCGGDGGEWDADGDGQASAAYPDRDNNAGTDCQDCTSACDGEPDWTSALSSADIYAGAPDAPYDGVDADCAGFDTNDDLVEDDYDVDLDGYVAAGETDSSGTRGTDCLDTDAGTFPGAPDVWYDGTDTDCGGEDDYDADFDAYVADEHFGLPTAGIADWTQLPAGDCLDDNDAYNPGELDTWYDGFDTDCGYEDDYDADSDGHREASFAGWSDLATYQDTTRVVAHSAASADDCDDTDASVSPSETEVPNNGIDDDCDEAGAPYGISGVNYPGTHNAGAVVGNSAYGFGYATAMGDLDGDGDIELAVGGYYDSVKTSSGGSVRWYSTTDMLGSQLNDSEVDGALLGDTSSAYLGFRVAIEDVTGDGQDDLVATAIRKTASSTTSGNDGVAYLLVGPLTGSMSVPWSGNASTATDAFFEGTQGAQAGRSLGLVDGDNDGQADILVGVPYMNITSGTTSYDGALLMWDGNPRSTISNEDDGTVVYGSSSFEYLGYSDAIAAGDIDGDGTNEVVVGTSLSSQIASSGGIAYALETPLIDGVKADDISLAEVGPDTAGDACGASVGAGDLDNDGYDDMIVGCTEHDSGAGALVVQYGQAVPATVLKASADLIVTGSRDIYDGNLGGAIRVGDTTGDGVDDVIVGELYYTPDTANIYTGRVVQLSGGTRLSGTLDADDLDGAVLGDNSQGLLGGAMALGEDVDGDGVDDLALSRQGKNLDGNSFGEVLLFTGGAW